MWCILCVLNKRIQTHTNPMQLQWSDLLILVCAYLQSIHVHSWKFQGDALIEICRLKFLFVDWCFCSAEYLSKCMLNCLMYLFIHLFIVKRIACWTVDCLFICLFACFFCINCMSMCSLFSIIIAHEMHSFERSVSVMHTHRFYL